MPDEKTLLERKLNGKGLTSPGMSVLFCYSKIILKDAILASDVPEDEHLKTFLIRSFPKPLQDRFSDQMQHHPLKREVIATKVSNIIINEMGFPFVFRMQDETGAPVSAIVRAYMIARSVLNMDELWRKIDELEHCLDAENQISIMLMYVRLLRRLTRWLLRNQRKRLDIGKAVKLYTPGMNELKHCIPEILVEHSRKKYDEQYQHLKEKGLTNDLAHELTVTRGLFAAMDIIEVARSMDIEVRKAAEIYFYIGAFLELDWIRTQVIIHSSDNHWEALSREALRDDLDWQQRQLMASIIKMHQKKKNLNLCFKTWAEKHGSLIERWRHILNNLRSISSLNYTMFFVATRELLDLTQTSLQMDENQDEKKLVEA